MAKRVEQHFTDHPGTTAREFAEAMGIEQPKAALIVWRLARMGLLRAERDQGSARGQARYFVVPDGAKKLAEANAKIARRAASRKRRPRVRRAASPAVNGVEVVTILLNLGGRRRIRLTLDQAAAALRELRKIDRRLGGKL